MAIVHEIPAEKLILAIAAEVKKMPEFKMPEWAYFVKTGISRSRPPAESEWWYKRAASILRQAYIKGIIGVNRLRTKYGSKQNRGMKPKRFKKAAGKNIRVILQQAERIGFLEKFKGKRTGRKLTVKGKEFIEKIAESIK